ncbi:MAG: response regulator [Spirochaetales bacterium]|nr:response regulator [Spirochaetales bacterium]
MESEKYITLGNILKRKRGTQDEQKVQEIIERNNSIDEKIAEIQKIDKLAHENRVKSKLNNFISSIMDPKLKMYVNQIKTEVMARLLTFEKNFYLKYILVVDDLTYITKTLSYVLKKEHFEVFTAKNSIEALILFQQILPDLVITDIRLPDFNGLELAALMRKIDSEVPIIFITANDIDKKSLDIIDGNKAYLQKPIKREELLETILKMFNEDIEEQTVNKK